MVRLELLERFAGLRQGMKVVDGGGEVVGQVRDISRRSLLVMEAGGTRVFWLDGDEIAGVDQQVVRLRRQHTPALQGNVSPLMA